MDVNAARFGTMEGRKKRERHRSSSERESIFGPVSREGSPVPVIPNPFYRDKHGQPFIPPNIFAKDSTSFPKLEDDDEEDELTENIQTILQSAVRRSIRNIKLNQIESRFDQLSLDSGLTRAELQLLRETKYDRSVVEDFLLGKWRDESRVKGYFRKAKPFVSNWIDSDGSQGVVRGFTSFIELLDWKRRAEEDIGRMNFDEFMKDPDTEVDWEYVSTVMYNEANTDRSGSHWKSSYKYFLGPHVRLLPSWNQEEITKLQSIIRKSKSLNFVKIASEMGPNYSPLICFQVYTNYIKGRKNPNPVPSSSTSAASSTTGADEIRESGSDMNKVPDSTDTYMKPWELSLFNEGMSESGADSVTKQIKDRVAKKTAFIDVEDAIILTTITELNTEHEHIKDLSCRDEVLDYLDVEYEEILEWRDDCTIVARLNTLFQGFYVRWTKREDRLLLALAHKYKHDWVKISKSFKQPFRSNRSLCRRFETLRRNLKDGTLEEYHEHLYGNFIATGFRTSCSYGLLRRALYCLKSLVLAYELGHNWVERYTRIHSLKKTVNQVYKHVKKYHSELLQMSRRSGSEEEEEIATPPREMKRITRASERKRILEAEARKRVAETEAKGAWEDHFSESSMDSNETYPVGDFTEIIVGDTNSDFTMEEQEFLENQLPDQQELLVQQELSELQEMYGNYELSAQELFEQLPEVQELSAHHEMCEQQELSKIDKSTELQKLSVQQCTPESNFLLTRNSPPTASDLIKYLWNMDIRAITRTLTFVTKFLALNAKKTNTEENSEGGNEEKSDTGSVRIKPNRSRRRRTGCSFDPTCPKSLATAVFLRRIELKSEDEMTEEERNALTDFESTTLAWFMWFSSRNCIKRSTRRKIPEMEELIRYPELQNLLRMDCSNIKWEPVAELFEQDPYVNVKVEDEKAGISVNHQYSPQSLHLRVNEESMQEEAEEWPSTLNSTEPEAVIVPDLTENFVSTAADHPDIPTNSLKTAKNGKGKKSSRLKQVRSEVARMRWAARKENAKIDKNKEEFITDNLVPEQ